MNIGDKIRHARLSKNIKQEELAVHLHISQGTLSKIENNTLSISVEEILKVASYTKTPINVFFPEEVQFSPPQAIVNVDQRDNTTILQRHLHDLEEWNKDLKTRNMELQEKIIRKDAKIESLKSQLASLVSKLVKTNGQSLLLLVKPYHSVFTAHHIFSHWAVKLFVMVMHASFVL